MSNDSNDLIKQMPVCKYCKSSDIVVDATAAWSKEKSEYVMTDTMDSFACESCGETGKFPDWLTISSISISDVSSHE